jgi:VWFA-related protein
MVKRPLFCAEQYVRREGNMKRTVFWTLIACVVASLASFGQAPLLLQEEKPPVFSVDVANVDVLFTVTDKKGKAVRNLKREQFKVYEDDYLQTITTFNAEGNLPLTVVLLVDVSGSVRDKLRFEQEAAAEFFQGALMRDKDRAVAISFDTRVEVIQDYTDDASLLARSMRRMRAGGGTALFDAVYLAVTRKLMERDGKRVLVIITDGDDTASRVSLNDALNSAQRNDVIIYGISTNGSGFWGERNRRGDDILRRLIEPTGGRVFSPSKAQQLSENFHEIAQELRYQYALSYNSTNLARDGAYRQIRVEPADKRYTVRARDGYFAPKSRPGVAAR